MDYVVTVRMQLLLEEVKKDPAKEAAYLSRYAGYQNEEENKA